MNNLDNLLHDDDKIKAKIINNHENLQLCPHEWVLLQLQQLHLL